MTLLFKHIMQSLPAQIVETLSQGRKSFIVGMFGGSCGLASWMSLAERPGWGVPSEEEPCTPHETWLSCFKHEGLLKTQDGNTGLVEELVAHQHRAFVSRLSRTFSAIPVSNIAGSVGSNVDEMTAFVETLIRDGYLNARLERDGKPEVGAVLRFYMDPTQGPLAKTEKQRQQALLQQTERTNALAEQVKAADYRLSVTKEYVEFVKRQSKKAAGSGGGDAMDVTWGEGDVDEEDIMGDLR